jgi:signal transduction histidine kinase
MTKMTSQITDICIDQETIASHWCEALMRATPDLVATEVMPHLTVLTQQITYLLLAESLDREKGRAIGKALARDVSPGAQILGRTLEVLAQRFNGDVPIEQAATLQPRLAGLLSELAVGFIQEKEVYISALQGQFLSATSHELRSPLNAVIGFSRVILKGVDGPITDLQEQDLTAVYNGGRQLLDLINDTFNIEKIEAGGIEVEPKTFEVKQLADSAAAEAQPIIEEYGNTLETHYPTDLGAMHSDPGKIKLVLLNLLANAAKFTRQGIVKLTVSRDTVDSTEWVHFQVTDTGLGMTPEQIGQFEQIGDSGTLEYGDLSLMISQRYCHMLGGHIAVASEVGKGTTFTARLPVQRE